MRWDLADRPAARNDSSNDLKLLPVAKTERAQTKENTKSGPLSLTSNSRLSTPYHPPEPLSALPLVGPAPRLPHPASLLAGVAPSPKRRPITSPPPHPRASNREFSLTLDTGLPAGVEDDGASLTRLGWPPAGIAVYVPALRSSARRGFARW
jgi:hypothetical protein